MRWATEIGQRVDIAGRISAQSRCQLNMYFFVYNPGLGSLHRPLTWLLASLQSIQPHSDQSPEQGVVQAACIPLFRVKFLQFLCIRWLRLRTLFKIDDLSIGKAGGGANMKLYQTVEQLSNSLADDADHFPHLLYRTGGPRDAGRLASKGKPRPKLQLMCLWSPWWRSKPACHVFTVKQWRMRGLTCVRVRPIWKHAQLTNEPACKQSIFNINRITCILKLTS